MPNSKGVRLVLAKMKGDIVGSYDGVRFEIPEGTKCKVIRTEGDTVIVDWKDDVAPIYWRDVELLDDPEGSVN